MNPSFRRYLVISMWTSLILLSEPGHSKFKKRTPQSIPPQNLSEINQSQITAHNFALISSDIFVLDKVVDAQGREKKFKDQKSVGRFISFTDRTTVSGYDGCVWFQQKYKMNKKMIQLRGRRSKVGECDKIPFVQTIPDDSFIVHYQTHKQKLTLTVPKTKQKFIYRKNIAAH